jgi:hypothetical protein
MRPPTVWVPEQVDQLGTELVPSLRWMLPRWNSTVLGLRNSGAATWTRFTVSSFPVEAG